MQTKKKKKKKIKNKMETASPYTQKVGVVLSGTMSQVIMSDLRKAPHIKGRVEDVSLL